MPAQERTVGDAERGRVERGEGAGEFDGERSGGGAQTARVNLRIDGVAEIASDSATGSRQHVDGGGGKLRGANGGVDGWIRWLNRLVFSGLRERAPNVRIDFKRARRGRGVFGIDAQHDLVGQAHALDAERERAGRQRVVFARSVDRVDGNRRKRARCVDRASGNLRLHRRIERNGGAGDVERNRDRRSHAARRILRKSGEFGESLGGDFGRQHATELGEAHASRLRRFDLRNGQIDLAVSAREIERDGSARLAAFSEGDAQRSRSAENA